MKDHPPHALGPNNDDTDDAGVWAHQDALLGQLHASALKEPVPQAWVRLAQTLEGRQAQQRQWAQWGGWAASVAVAFGVGWFSQTWWQRSDAAVALHFARDAALAHAVYTPEVRHPVEVAAAQQEHLVQWLSKRLGHPLKVPHLQAQGFELVGGRLLPGSEGARAQFMFESAQGQRVTLYLGALSTTTPSTSQSGFQFANEHGVARFYWADQGQGYALAANLPREHLLALATEVYRQLADD